MSGGKNQVLILSPLSPSLLRCSTGEGLCAAPISMAAAAMNSNQGTSALPSTRLLLKPSLARASSQLTPSCL